MHIVIDGSGDILNSLAGYIYLPLVKWQGKHAGWDGKRTLRDQRGSFEMKSICLAQL